MVKHGPCKFPLPEIISISLINSNLDEEPTVLATSESYPFKQSEVSLNFCATYMYLWNLIREKRICEDITSKIEDIILVLPKKTTVFFGYLVSSSIIENRKVGIWLFLAENLIFAFPLTYFLVYIKDEAWQTAELFYLSVTSLRVATLPRQMGTL